MRSSSSVYLEYRPPGGLSPVVECFWRRDGPRDQRPDAGILPDGRIDLVWTDEGTALVAGPQTGPVERPLRPPFVAIGARFHPGAAAPLLGLPAHELVDRHVPLEALDTRAATSLDRCLSSADDPEEALARLRRALGALTRAAPSGDPLVGDAARLLAAPDATVDEVAHAVALSQRQLQRRFREAVGYGPKTLQRVLRFQRLLAALERGRAAEGGLARIAAAIGYADQAHLTRESRALSNLSPLELERLWAAPSARPDTEGR